MSMPVTNDDQPLTRKERIRRVVILCVLFMRNLAYFRGAYEVPEGWRNDDLVLPDASFWRTVANNALDMCVLEFCKLFADERGRHAWRTIVSDPKDFEASLMQRLEFTDEQYRSYLETFRIYRNKFVAHLDDRRTMDIPGLDAAKLAVQHLHAWIVAKECEPGWLDYETDSAEKLAAGYEVEKATAKRIYQQIRRIGEG